MVGVGVHAYVEQQSKAAAIHRVTTRCRLTIEHQDQNLTKDRRAYKEVL